ncbi:MAG: hypothetical protein LBB98_02885 [Treponema sp.]|jgi:hypothetical protein|nr:hypothetical protein [Treponema sp.]
MALCEYSTDYGDEAFKTKTATAISRELPAIMNEKIRRRTEENLKKIRQGQRDFYV